MNDYSQFIERKLSTVTPCGITDGADLSGYALMPHQSDLSAWALRRGRCAIFADTGLGKTRMQLAWANEIHKATGHRVLILAPLAVADQTVREGVDIGVQVTRCREADDVAYGVNITNYDRMHKFDAAAFGAVVLDESSCIKHHDTKTLARLLAAFANTPYKLCATATPAPNDWTELGTHAEFLGVCTRAEMLAEYFVHDGGETQVWRLKGHARAQFWKWVSGWGAMVRKPSDLGHDDRAYDLPPLTTHQHTVESNAQPDGMLFALEAQTLSERRKARKESMEPRVSACAEIVNASDEPWIIWCELNAEADALKASIPDAVEIRGPDDADTKEQRLNAFADGRIRVLITKCSIAGWGLNWQHCARVAFVGVTDSFESYYQAVRRCWRFGQKREVQVHIFASELEGAVVSNLKRKESDANAMAESLSAETREAVQSEVRGQARQTNAYAARKPIAAPAWLHTENAA